MCKVYSRIIMYSKEELMPTESSYSASNVSLDMMNLLVMLHDTNTEHIEHDHLKGKKTHEIW